MLLVGHGCRPATCVHTTCSDDRRFFRKEKQMACSRELSLIKGVPVIAVPCKKCSKFPVMRRIRYKASLAMPFLRTRESLQVSSLSNTRRCAMICAAAFSVSCAAEQTQGQSQGQGQQTVTITRESSNITNAPTQGKEKSPELDDGGTGFPPRDDDGGGGGGGGGGGPNYSGGFFFFGLLAFLGLLKDNEKEAGGGYFKDQRKKYSY